VFAAHRAIGFRFSRGGDQSGSSVVVVYVFVGADVTIGIIED